MKLEKVLSEMNPEEIVAIGSNNGTGFIYIGRAGDIAAIELCFVYYVDDAENKLREYRRNLNKLILNAPYVPEKASEDGINEIVDKQARLIMTSANGIKNHSNYLKKYVDPLERTVKETYHKTVDECTAIIISGSEAGGFWTRKEFDKAWNNKLRA